MGLGTLKAYKNQEIGRLDMLLMALFTRLSNVHNQVILHHLDDLLRPIEILSLKLQKKNLHPFDTLLHIQSMMVELEETFLDDNVQLCGRSFNSLKSKVEDGSILLSGGGLVNTVLSSCKKTMRDPAKSVVKNSKKGMWCNDDIISKFLIFKLGKNSKKLGKADFASYGEDEMTSLVDFYSETYELDGSKIQAEWKSYKYSYLRANVGAGNFDWKATLRLCDQSAEAFPNLRLFAPICEHLDYAQMLDKLLRLGLSAASYDKFDYSKWLEGYLKGTIYSVGKAAKKAKHCGDNANDCEEDEDDDEKDLDEISHKNVQFRLADDGAFSLLL
uniref:Uncharacterized protein n=1 Tax=Romanomermis culicivorax TaxID=13658 RepID=A0A915JG37_ROMCU